MLDRRDRGTWGGRRRGRGRGREGWKHGVFLQRVEKRLLRVSHYFFLFYVYCRCVRVAEFEGSQRGIFWVIGLFVLRLFSKGNRLLVVVVKVR